jgi:exosortase/archaeosortase family protein
VTIDFVKNQFYQIRQQPVGLFILRFSIFWIIWWLAEWIFPSELEKIDGGITHFVTYMSAYLQNWIHGTTVTVGGPHTQEPWCLISQNSSVVRIGDACNGRNLIVLYLSFLLSIPIGDFENKMVFAITGVVFILLMNILRIYGLFQVALTAPQFFQFLHKYLFQSFIYFDMFILWRSYLTLEIKSKIKSDLNVQGT